MITNSIKVKRKTMESIDSDTTITTTPEMPKKKHHTERQLNTIRLIHEKVAAYDNLCRRAILEQTTENKQKQDDYSLHLRNVSQLASYISTFTENVDGYIWATSKIRALITAELKSKSLIISDGLIRNPKTDPYVNLPASGNTMTILLPTNHLEEMRLNLSQLLVDEPVRILAPCNNMILVIETGSSFCDISRSIYQKVRQEIGEFLFEHSLKFSEQNIEKHNYLYFIN